MKPFVPHHLPLENIDFERLFPIIADASAELARYDGLLQGIPNAAVMLSPLTTQEAVLSSKIEGTQAIFLWSLKIPQNNLWSKNQKKHSTNKLLES